MGFLHILSNTTLSLNGLYRLNTSCDNKSEHYVTNTNNYTNNSTVNYSICRHLQHSPVFTYISLSKFFPTLNVFFQLSFTIIQYIYFFQSYSNRCYNTCHNTNIHFNMQLLKMIFII